MSKRDLAKIQIDVLPDSAVDKVIEFISFQLYTLGLVWDAATIQESLSAWGEFDRIVAESADENDLLNDAAFARNATGRSLINFGEV